MLHTLHSSIEVMGLSRQLQEILKIALNRKGKNCFDHFDCLNSKISIAGGTNILAAS